MSPLATSCIVFGCIFGGTLLGMVLRAFLPEKHLSAETKDVVKLGMGLIGTMTALVLGLLIASAKSSYDAQRNGLMQMSANIIVLDRTLAHYGSESKDVRDRIHEAVEDMLSHAWPGEYRQSGSAEAPNGTEGRYEDVLDKIQALKPDNDAQRALQAQALKTAGDIAQTRWSLFAQKGGSIPTPFLVVLVFWLTLLFASFGLFAPRNATAVITLLICAAAVSTAMFLILELDQPFGGIMQISSAPLRSALAQLGRP
jgi:Protein of unknown function (DUF4239)